MNPVSWRHSTYASHSAKMFLDYCLFKIHSFLRYVGNSQTDRQTDRPKNKQTNPSKNITFLTAIFKNAYLCKYYRDSSTWLSKSILREALIRLNQRIKAEFSLNSFVLKNTKRIQLKGLIVESNLHDAIKLQRQI